MPTATPRRLLARTASAALLLTAPPALAQPPAAPPASAAPSKPAPDDLRGVARIAHEADALRPLFDSQIAASFLSAARALPAIEPRTIHRAPDGAWLTDAQAKALPEDERAALKPTPIDETRYYNTKYGSPLAYVRALDLAATCGATPPLASLEGARILDYGYGTVGHLRMMACLGAHATGVDVDPFLTALYSEPADAGRVPTCHKASEGSITLASGRFPADEGATAAISDAAAGGYDLITSKNTLKNGYINPARPVDPRMLVDLGVDHDTFVRALFDQLKPGGLVVIYNLSPAPSNDDEPYKPWADGRCPFPRETWEKAGFAVVAFDESDDTKARAMARALGWDKGGMNLETDLFSHYTIVQRPAK